MAGVQTILIFLFLLIGSPQVFAEEENDLNREIQSEASSHLKKSEKSAVPLATAGAVSASANEKSPSKSSLPAADSTAGDEDSNGELEALYDKFDSDQKQQTLKKKELKSDGVHEKPPELTQLSELVSLAPFDDVAVIQKRFLPRTQRFELSGSGMTVLNNPFFNNMGLGGRLAYHLSEKHAIEGQYMFFSNANRGVTDDLEQKRNVRTSNLVSTKTYMGASYKWTPFFGKITFMNEQIVPFDLFFNFGGGLTKTQVKSEPTLQLGTGQSFALSKKMAVRWDLVWNFFQAEVPSVKDASTTKSTHSDLYLSVGVGFFFPEAKYR